MKKNLLFIIFLTLSFRIYAQWNVVLYDTTSTCQLLSADFSSTFGLAVGHKIYKSDNNGDNWVCKYNATPNYLSDVSVLDSNISYAVGILGNVIKTNDGGENWYNLDPNTNLDLYTLFFFDTLNGFICGEDGLISKTIDGGINWQSNSVGTGCFFDITFINDSIGYVVGGHNDLQNGNIDGYLYKTTDSGNSWVSKLWNDRIIVTVDFPTQMIGYCSSNSGDLFKTIDGGETWTNIPLVGPSNIYSLKFISADTGFAVGTAPTYNPGFIYKTTDGGDSWSTVYNVQYISPYVFLYHINVINKERMFAFGDNSLILKYDTISGFEDFSNESNFAIYPNPTEGLLHINVNKNFGDNFVLNIFDITGQLILQRHYDFSSIGNSFILDLRSLRSGLYLVVIKGTKEYFMKKLLITKP